MTISKTRYALALLFCVAVVGYVVSLFMRFPAMSLADRESLSLSNLRAQPDSLSVAKLVSRVLSNYTGEHYFAVLQACMALYIVLQALSIPGTAFLTVAIGSLFGLYVGVALSLLSSLVGASLSYWMSYFVGGMIVPRVFPALTADFKRRVDENRGHLLNYMLFLRVTPLLPNFFINLASPLFGVPYWHFAVATLFGIVPAVFMLAQGGVTINELESIADLSRNWKSFALMFSIGLLVLLPTFKPVQRRLDSLLNRRVNVKDE
jgi:transmembrane protein 41